ncbi:MAG: hypothetical protein GQ569_12920 [Methylococcaceae bacterium]|nr:hypothetical protein [Methylococcaceae bacterium]
MSAGMIPFSVFKGEVYFLFQKTFSGRKQGYLIDFGGGGDEGESYQQTAMREFVEETETLFFADDINSARRTPERVLAQLSVIENVFSKTLTAHPDWWCQRHTGNKVIPKDWRTFFIEVDYQDTSPLNKIWENDSVGRFKKRRELQWVLADELLEIYQNQPERLWKRVRQLIGVEKIIEDIKAAKN